MRKVGSYSKYINLRHLTASATTTCRPRPYVARLAEFIVSPAALQLEHSRLQAGVCFQSIVTTATPQYTVHTLMRTGKVVHILRIRTHIIGRPTYVEGRRFRGLASFCHAVGGKTFFPRLIREWQNSFCRQKYLLPSRESLY